MELGRSYSPIPLTGFREMHFFLNRAFSSSKTVVSINVEEIIEPSIHFTVAIRYPHNLAESDSIVVLTLDVPNHLDKFDQVFFILDRNYRYPFEYSTYEIGIFDPDMNIRFF